MSMRTPRSPWSQPRQSPRLSPVGQAYNVNESNLSKEIECRTDCSYEMFDLLKTTRGLNPTDLTVKARNRERCWGSLQLAWLARNVFEEWRSVTLIANFSGAVAPNNSKNDTSGDWFGLLSELQHELAAKDDLIAQLRKDLRDASAKNLHEKLESMVRLFDAAFQLRGVVQCFNAWLSYCNNCRFVAQFDSKHEEEQVFRAEEFNGKDLAAVRTVVLDTASKTLDLLVSADPLATCRHYFFVWCKYHSVNRQKMLRSIKMADHLNCIQSRMSLLESFSAWSQLLQQVYVCRRAKSLTQSVQMAVSRQAQRLYDMQAKDNLLHAFIEWSVLGTRHCRLKALVSLSRDIRTLRFHAKIFRAWAKKCASFKLLMSLDRISLLVATPLHEASIRNIFLCWRLDVDQSCRRRESCAYEERVADADAEKIRHAAECNAEIIERTAHLSANLRKNILFNRVYFYDSMSKATAFSAWKDFYNGSVKLVLSHRRDSQWVIHYRSLHDSASLFMWARFIFQTWYFAVGFHLEKGYVNNHRPLILRTTILPFRVFMHWMTWINHNAWRRKQQELVSLLTQVRTHLSKAEADRLEFRDSIHMLAHRNIRAYVLMSFGLATTRILLAWRNVVASFHQDGMVDDLRQEAALLRQRVREGKLRSVEERRSKNSALTLEKVFVRWRIVVRHTRNACKLDEDLNRLKRRDLAISGHLIRLEYHRTLHLVYSTWRGFIVDIRNMEVVERLINDRQMSKVRFEARISCLVDNSFAGRLILITFLVLHSWRQELINSRMRCSLAYVQNMATNIRHQVMRRIHQKRQTLLSNCLDSWRWTVDSAIQRQRNSLRQSSQPALNHTFDHTLCDGQHRKTYETYTSKSSVLSLQGFPAWPGQVIDSRVNVSPRSMASCQRGVLRG